MIYDIHIKTRVVIWLLASFVVLLVAIFAAENVVPPNWLRRVRWTLGILLAGVVIAFPVVQASPPFGWMPAERPLLEKEATPIIMAIDAYRKSHGSYPARLRDAYSGPIENRLYGPWDYQTSEDEDGYVLSLGTPEINRFVLEYYSSTQQWTMTVP